MRSPTASSFLLLLTLGLAASPSIARAEKVLVLNFQNDTDGQLRKQVEAAVDKAARVERVPYAEYARVAMKQGLRPEDAVTAESVRKIAPELGVHAVVTGSVETKISLRILDGMGVFIWSKVLPKVDGHLSANHARRLASALAAAAESPASSPTAASAATAATATAATVKGAAIPGTNVSVAGGAPAGVASAQTQRGNTPSDPKTTAKTSNATPPAAVAVAAKPPSTSAESSKASPDGGQSSGSKAIASASVVPVTKIHAAPGSDAGSGEDYAQSPVPMTDAGYAVVPAQQGGSRSASVAPSRSAQSPRAASSPAASAGPSTASDAGVAAAPVANAPVAHKSSSATPPPNPPASRTYAQPYTPPPPAQQYTPPTPAQNPPPTFARAPESSPPVSPTAPPTASMSVAPSRQIQQYIAPPGPPPVAYAPAPRPAPVFVPTAPAQSQPRAYAYAEPASDPGPPMPPPPPPSLSDEPRTVVSPRAPPNYLAPPPSPYPYALNQPLRPPPSVYYGYVPIETIPAPVVKPKVHKKKKPPPPPDPIYGPRVFRLELGAMGVLRSYCARPGVKGNCASYDNLAMGSRPAGPTADFDWAAIYPGGLVSAELFPLAGVDSIWLRGLGLLGGYGRGFSSARQPSTTASGQATEVPVNSIDERYWAMVTSRYYFGWQDHGPVNGFVGLKFGYVSRSFLPDSPAGVFLPATQRHLWALGLNLQIPFSWWMKLELSGMYYFGAGVSNENAVALGSQDGSLGFSLGAGLSGDFAADFPLGYFARAQWDRFDGHFVAGGTVWPQGGVTQEFYVTFTAGLSLSF